ncbi:MAG TPA: glycine zipper domain-containing protein [Tepidisphaeraceae bacterium]|jgi:uncharacterized protein YcfJ
MKRAAVVVSVLSMGVLSAGLAGCQTNAGTGALIGGAAGAGIGAIVGHASHGHTAGGAAIGGAAGAIGGALIGNEMDKKEREEAHERDSYRDRDYYRDRDGGADYSRNPGYTPDASYDRDPYASGRSNNSSGSGTSYRDTRYESRAVLTKQDVIDWTRRGDRDDQIIDRIDHGGTIFRLSSRDENDLRDAGVSEEVIRAMKDTARR